VLNAHRTEDQFLIAMFNSTISESVFARILFRGPDDWHGEKGNPDLRIEVRKVTSPLDVNVRALLMLVRYLDADGHCHDHSKPPRVVQVSQDKWTGIWSMREGGESGRWFRCLHLGLPLSGFCLLPSAVL